MKRTSLKIIQLHQPITFLKLKPITSRALEKHEFYEFLSGDRLTLPLRVRQVGWYAISRIKEICGNIREVELKQEEELRIGVIQNDVINVDFDVENSTLNSKLVNKPKFANQSLPVEIAADVKQSKGFCGLPLNFIPNIRKSEVSSGTASKVLNLFGINQKVGTNLKLFRGPNKKVNRYLKHQYKRLIQSIGGRIAYKKVYSEALKSHVLVSKVSWVKSLTSTILETLQLDEQKVLRAKFRKFWNIAINLLTNSRAYRLTLLIKTLGRKDRWFHRDISISELAAIEIKYLKIVKNQRTETPMWRTWIPQVDKFRPLAVAPKQWRMYTGGLANFLYVFLNCSWPENQHGYTCGRGVNTAWEFILNNIIKYKYIFEFDLVGYFNNITHRCVARTLAESNVPKGVIILIMEVCTSDVINIKPAAAKKLLDTEEYPPPFNFVKDWEKHEYIPFYRKGWRPRGFGQGNSLSPIVSVFPLLLTRIMKRYGIECLSYCDDGILYGNEYADYAAILQEVLDEGDTGVKISGPKSRWVKLGGVWQHPLKFVGMVFDPFTGILSGATRKGSTLPMSIELVGLVSNSARYTIDTHSVENHVKFIKQYGDSYKPLDLTLNPLNKRMLELSDFVYTSGIWSVVDLMPPDLVRYNWNLWNFLTVLKHITDFPGSEDNSFAFRLDSNEDGIWQYYFNMESVDKYMAEALLEDLKIVENVEGWNYFPSWAPAGLHRKSLLDIRDHMREVIVEYGSYNSVKATEGYPEVSYSTPSETLKNQVNLLCWYKTEIKNSLFENFDKINKELNLQSHEDVRLFKIDPLSVLFEKLPESAIAIGIRENWDVCLGISRLNWANTVNTKLFSTLIARVFANSFDLSNVKQDFNLEYEDDTLMDFIRGRNYSSREWARFLHQKGGMDTFNSTTIAAFVLNDLLKYWDSLCSKKLRKNIKVNDSWREMYSKLRRRLINRRVGTAKNCSDFKLYKKLLKQNNPFYVDGKSYKELLIEELTANGIKTYNSTSKFRKAAHKKADILLKKGMPLNAIIFANCSEKIPDEASTVKRINSLKASIVSKPKNTDWLTWAPFVKGPRK